jgi:hypothetical protein
MPRCRSWFVVAALLIVVGSAMHPGGSMEEMLADPKWIPGHLLAFVGFVAMTFGLRAFRQQAPGALHGTLRLAVIGTALQAVEMFVHTMAYVDAEALQAGLRTPVLSTHLFMTAVVYPLFAATTIAFIVQGARHHVVGSWWIAPLGILGVAAHGVAGLLVAGFDVLWARALFPGIAAAGIWLLLAGLWPSKAPAIVGASSRRAVSEPSPR